MPPDPGEAKARLIGCLQRERDSAWLYLLRGFASTQLGTESLARAERSPVSRDLIQEQADSHFADAVSDYNRALGLLDRKPDDALRYAVLENRGVLRLLRRDLDKAAQDFQAAIRLDERSYVAYASLADVLWKKGQPEEAVAEYGKAIARKPDMAALYRDRAGIGLAQTDSTPAQRAQALGDLERAIQREQAGNPVLARDHVNRRGCWPGITMRPSAAACEEAIKVVRNYADAHELRIKLLLELKGYDDVIRSCNPLIAQARASAAIYELRGLAREANKDFAGAIEDFTGAMALGGDRAKLLKQRGRLYILAAAPQLGLHDFQAAIRLDPSQGDAYTGRGFARLRLGEHREGIADAEKGVSLGETTPARAVYRGTGVCRGERGGRRRGPQAGTGQRGPGRALSRTAPFLLRRAPRLMPEDQRATFWRDVIPADPALGALRRRLSATELVEPVASAASKRDGKQPGSSSP